jgi:Pyruvate/2-oxoacid:ferredoxin oxidoreductase delta subunit
MAHRLSQSAYLRLTERINRFPQGVTPSATLHKILSLLFSERDAELVSLLPVKPFTAERAAQVWGLAEGEARTILDNLAERALLVDFEQMGTSHFVLPPPMAGFFEFSLMRVRGDLDQKLLAELFYQYMNVEEEFIRALFTEGDTQLGRTFVHEPVLPQGPWRGELHVLDYERASEVIKTASHIGIGDCYCRRKMELVGRACDAPVSICMTLNTTGDSLIRHGHAREVDAVEGLELLAEAYENNLVQFGENVREEVNFLCNCCGCCCEAMIASRKFALLHPVHTTNFIPAVEERSCTSCAKCVNVCPVEAMVLVSANDPANPGRKVARVDNERCLGCGLCVRVCPAEEALTLKRRAKRVLTPLNGAHRAVVMALERGKLQNLLFDNQLLKSHRALAAIFGVILKLPPLKQALATDQVKSRYLEALIRRFV